MGRQVELAHPYVPVGKREPLEIGCLIDSKDDNDLHCHMMAVDTSTVSRTVQAIEEHLSVRGSRRQVCKAIGEEGESRPIYPN